MTLHESVKMRLTLTGHGERDRDRRPRQVVRATGRWTASISTVAAGEVHGFLGPNGAGKSTTIRVLLGLLHADGGRVRLLGGDPWRDAAALHERLAYVPGDVNLWPTLTGGEVIDLLGRLRGGLDRARRDDLIERFELDPRRAAAPTPRATARRSR